MRIFWGKIHAINLRFILGFPAQFIVENNDFAVLRFDLASVVGQHDRNESHWQVRSSLVKQGNRWTKTTVRQSSPPQQRQVRTCDLRCRSFPFREAYLLSPS